MFYNMCRNPPYIYTSLVVTLFLHLCIETHAWTYSFIFTSSGDSLLVNAASPSSFGHVITSGPPVSKASPAISLFEVQYYVVIITEAVYKNQAVKLTASIPVTQLLMLLYKPGKKKTLKKNSCDLL